MEMLPKFLAHSMHLIITTIMIIIKFINSYSGCNHKVNQTMILVFALICSPQMVKSSKCRVEQELQLTLDKSDCHVNSKRNSKQIFTQKHTSSFGSHLSKSQAYKIPLSYNTTAG